MKVKKWMLFFSVLSLAAGIQLSTVANADSLDNPYLGVVISGGSAVVSRHFDPPRPPEVIAQLDTCTDAQNGAVVCFESKRDSYLGVTLLGESAIVRQYYHAPKPPKLIASLRCDASDTRKIRCWERPVQIKACSEKSETYLRMVTPGFKCRTTNGAIYERVTRDNFGEAWKGPDGLIYSDFIGKYSQYDAIEICKNLGSTLPSQADFDHGEANGFREVLPTMKNRWYWSSSVPPGDSGYAYYLIGHDGGTNNPDNRYSTYSVRCVAR